MNGKMKKVLSVLMTLILAFSAVAVPAAAAGSSAPEADYVQGEVLIISEKQESGYHGGLSTCAASQSVIPDFDAYGVTSVETVSEDSSAVVFAAETQGNVEKLCRELNREEGITAEPNYLLHTTAYSLPKEVTDPSDYYNRYQKVYYNDALKIPGALKFSGKAGDGVLVAIIDTGFATDALDFPVNLWKNKKGTVGWNVSDNNDKIGPIFKSDGKSTFVNTNHGSNIAGIIAMPANGTGGIGVAYNSKLMLIKAATYTNDSSEPLLPVSDIVKGIDLAIENGADVINLSASVTKDSTTLKNAVNKAYNAGIAVISSAGNDSKGSDKIKSYPGAYDSVIGVMATESTTPTRLSRVSNYDVSGGKYYNMAVPGEDIFGCSSPVAGKYSAMTGTSQACAIVSGLAAVYLSVYPGTTPAQLYKALKDSVTGTVSANPSVTSATYSYGRPDTLKLMKAGGKKECACHTEGQWKVSVQPTAAKDGKRILPCSVCGKTLKSETVYRGVSAVSVGNVSLNYKSTATLTPSVKSGTKCKYTVKYSSAASNIASVDANGKISGNKRGSTTVTCTVTDEYGHTVKDTCTVTVGYAWWQWIIKIVLFGWIWY